MMPINEIRSHYEYLTPLILKHSDKYKQRWVSPYCAIQWAELFSPIEESTWQSIRSFGKAPFYPQYPVNNYFIDFGNPKVKVGIECDGKEWHTDRERDRKRDVDLLNEGWMIFRISGSDCNRVIPEYHHRFDYDNRECDVADVLRQFYKTVDGLIKAISIFYFNHQDYSFFEIETRLAYECLLRYTSVVCFDTIREYADAAINTLYTNWIDYKAEMFNVIVLSGESRRK